MTEESFQEARKLMQSANYLRGLITKAKMNVGKWTRLEDYYRRELHEPQANAAQKNILKAITRLDELRAKFKALKFPEDKEITIQI